jgi:hypothetical protein
MSNAIAGSLALLVFALIAIGLWDLFRGLNTVAVFVALFFLIVGFVNCRGALKR